MLQVASNKKEEEERRLSPTLLTHVPKHITMTKKREYTDEQRETYCALAQEIGLSPAIRKLGYPTHPSAMKWLEARGIKITLDSLMQQLKAHHTLYQVDDLLTVVETGIGRAVEMYSQDSLTPDDLLKAASATTKLVNSWQILKGKATQINETRTQDGLDVELLELLNIEKAKNKEARP